MSDKQRTYIAIDLKSFYASVECVERGLDPLDTCLVVADASRTEKTICLAVSPALKAYGTGGRPRLFEVVQRVREVNRTRGRSGKSYSARALAADPGIALDYIVAPPRMAFYIDYSTRVYQCYLKYIAPEDMHVYSIDEVFIDATDYLKTYGCDAHELALRMIRDVLATTGVTATAGIGSNLYLCKIAMDIMAKKMPPDSDGVRIAALDEDSYRRLLWTHTPLTDFWRTGRGIAARLAPYGIFTMGDIARRSVSDEGLFYRLFGVNAELLIDHAWGYEPTMIADIKAYRPESKSLSTGQVLTRPYSVAEARTIVQEMADSLALEVFGKHLVTDKIVLEVGYDVESLSGRAGEEYTGRVSIDRYGRRVPFHAHGTASTEGYTAACSDIIATTAALYDRIVDPQLKIRRMTLTACELKDENDVNETAETVQLNLFEDFDRQIETQKRKKEDAEKERRRQQAILNIKQKFGKNAILRGLNYAEGATQRDRNRQIGGHHE